MAKEDKLRALEAAINQIEKQYGKGSVMKLGDTSSSMKVETVPSGSISLDIALDFMNRRPERQGRSRTLILSDILQTGVPPMMFYSHVAQLIESRGLECLMAVGPVVSAHRDCFQHLSAQCYFFPDTPSLLQSEAFQALHDSLVLIKGARSFHFDQVTDLLEYKVHETILEVNLNAVVGNLNYYRSFLRPETKVVCMVKADAYGAGAVEIAKTLQDHRVDYLAVAVADEGATLRQAGVSSNIMVMNPEMTSFHTLFQYHLEPEVYSFRLLDALIRAAEKEGITDFPVHIKLDTGMHRLGFDPIADMPQLIDRLRRQTALIPRSVFSHFVGSDSEDFDEFSSRQFALFERGADALQAVFHHHILRHMCNSAAISRFPERQMDMVRLGLGLYGIDSCTNELLNNVSTLKTTILQIHDVPAGESIGYSRRTVLDRDSRIAALPIGYADGLNRRLGNRQGFCLVNGHRAPYVGNICMDVCMIDVTDIPCQEGDTAIIFSQELSPSLLAEKIGTIPYEILTGVSNRVKRVYIFE